mmetsp:Transcript_47439/g.118517  ORF Transcript_47439/g.118517 Transcript_47439/m.118517 type:complete len:109 (-) Transcript_47439:84-410(-)
MSWAMLLAGLGWAGGGCDIYGHTHRQTDRHTNITRTSMRTAHTLEMPHTHTHAHRQTGRQAGEEQPQHKNMRHSSTRHERWQVAMQGATCRHTHTHCRARQALAGRIR